MKNKYKVLILSGILASSLVLPSCGGSDEEVEDTPNPPKTGPIVPKGEQTGFINIGGQVFVIPSPIQTADLIANSNADYNGDLLNPTDKSENYTNTFSKALNMGVYGADLGYLAVYNITDRTTAYLKSVRGLADDIGLGSAFNDELAGKISESLGDESKLLQLVSEAYETADDYLKENKKDNVASLVIIGGWLESLYFACEVAKETQDQAIIERIADQKTVLSTVLKMLDQYRDDEEYDDLAIELEDLQSIFDNITYTYEYVPTTTNEAEKTTTISSKHNVSITPEQVDEISEKVKSIRKEIIG